MKSARERAREILGEFDHDDIDVEETMAAILADRAEVRREVVDKLKYLIAEAEKIEGDTIPIQNHRAGAIHYLGLALDAIAEGGEK